jgi:Tfp pilus assembly protein PilN
MSSVDITVAILTVPRRTIDSVMMMLKKAGLKVKFMTVRPLGLAQLAEDSAAIVVNVNPIGFDIALVVNGIAELLRSINFAGMELTLDQKVTEVVQELNKTISFYNAGENHVQLASDVATFVTGELGATVAESIRARVKPLPRRLSYPADFDDYRYGANIGLAQLRLSTDRNNHLTMNTIPDIYLPKVRVVPIAGLGFLMLCIIVLAFFGYITYGEVAKTAALQAQVTEATARVTQIQGEAKTTKDLEKQRDTIKAQLTRLKTPLTNTRAQREKIYGDLASVTRLLPGLITLKSIECGQSLTVHGSAGDKEIILTYTRDLRDTGRFSSVLLSNMSEAEYNIWNFTVNLK